MHGWRGSPRLSDQPTPPSPRFFYALNIHMTLLFILNFPCISRSVHTTLDLVSRIDCIATCISLNHTSVGPAGGRREGLRRIHLIVDFRVQKKPHFQAQTALTHTGPELIPFHPRAYHVPQLHTVARRSCLAPPRNRDLPAPLKTLGGSCSAKFFSSSSG